MAEDSDLERTEPASSKRLEEARSEGQVPHSRELLTFAVLIAAGGGFGMMGATLMSQLSSLVSRGLTFDRSLAFDPMKLADRLYSLSSEALFDFLPFFGLLLVAAIASSVLLGGWVFTMKTVMPNFAKLDPLAGIGRIFSINSLVELGKAILKSILIGGVAAWVMWHNKEAFFSLMNESLPAGIAHMGHLIFLCFMTIVGSMALIVAIDVPFQLWEHAKKLRMTKEEVRKEARESEGDPQVKGKIRQMQREMARRRMMAEIPKADVIVTNPTHYAVALKYQENSRGAPKVVARGSHLIAARIREIGQENDIPVMEAPPLARALYFNCEIGDEIPEALYAAVAEVLAYVFQLRRGANVEFPKDIHVPRELDPEAA